MSEILEAVKIRLRFDTTGEFEKALLQLLRNSNLFNYQIQEMIESLEWAAKSGNYADLNHLESMADAIIALDKVRKVL